ncbi:histidine kinase dimerization/phospho-acceptor domain-containing protein [Novosphingobium sp.]|uniref:sensor histidine kinase n=1 Tax=Novosphingobium sp. TaxID=1874826 RepID=UPI00261CE480|nr:histidine kinase dimerization/phospho-acceptor domain-containing protein [Novosphingobium sp.]
MHIDDRLATVLAVSATGDNQIRVQFRQLVDLLGTMPTAALGTAADPAVDRAMLRLGALSRRIPPAERAAALDRSGVRLRNARLVAELACDHPAVAEAAIRMARLGEEQWLDILPTLPPGVRGLLRQRRDLGTAVIQRLDQLGASGPGLPAPPSTETAAAPRREDPPALAVTADDLGGKVLPLRARAEPPSPAPAATPAVPLPAAETLASAEAETARPTPSEGAARDGIGAIVRRIEAFRRTREATRPAANDAPFLPLVEEGDPARLQAFAFACDSSGRIVWTDASLAGMIVGLLLPLAERSSSQLASAFRRRLPVRATPVELDGPAAIAGPWLLDAAPEFDGEGRCTGYTGKFRRPSPVVAAQPANPEAVRVRQVLHELRTPVNAIQGFAELIHQQLVGPVPHGYRALAAGIAADAAQMLAGFEELERLARLDSGAMAPEPGEADMGALVEALIAQLVPFTGPRQSGFALTTTPADCRVGLSHADAERLGWRLLATLAGAARPGERLSALLQSRDGMVTLTLGLPEALAALPDPFEGHAPLSGQSLSGGLFGGGFALRLAAAEARSAGGSLTLRDRHVILALPAPRAERLTAPDPLPNPLQGLSGIG